MFNTYKAHDRLSYLLQIALLIWFYLNTREPSPVCTHTVDVISRIKMATQHEALRLNYYCFSYLFVYWRIKIRLVGTAWPATRRRYMPTHHEALTNYDIIFRRISLVIYKRNSQFELSTQSTLLREWKSWPFFTRGHKYIETFYLLSREIVYLRATEGTWRGEVEHSVSLYPWKHLRIKSTWECERIYKQKNSQRKCK